jgi:ATP-dependent 26S proteasome regulatory subunit
MNDFSCFREKPECGFSEVSNQHVKREFRKVAAFLRGDQAFADWGCEPPRGVLLYGPPGTGKTLLARALAAEVSCPFYAPPSTVFLNLWYGNTEHHLRTLWTQASAHPEGAIIFLDEFDALGSRRSRLANPTGNEPQVATVGCLLELMGGLRRSKSRLVVIAATNRLDNIDPAFLRPGRFDFTIEVPRPTELELAEILLIHLRKVERRARRLDVLTPELQEWIRTTRVSALSEAGDWTGQEPPRIREMARIAARHRMVGAHVDEWVRRVVFDRAVSQAEKGDPGPIGCEDLQRELDALIKERLEHLEDKPWFSEELQGGKN